MDARIHALLAGFARAEDAGPDGIASCLQSLPVPGMLPSPWETWALIGLVRHRARQFWVADIVRRRLRGAPSDLAAISAFEHSEGVPQSGPVPGMPEWEYYFHGRGCCISHKIEGDAIDVDFWDDSAEYFDTFFYKNYLGSLCRPEPPEQRLRELHPSACTVSIALDELISCRALTPLPGRESHPYRLAEEVLSSIDAISAFCTAWADQSRRIWLAALIGDWPAADEAASGWPDLTAITSPRAEQCREIRRQRLREELQQPNRASNALQTLADLGAADLDRCLEDVLRRAGRPQRHWISSGARMIHAGVRASTHCFPASLRLARFHNRISGLQRSSSCFVTAIESRWYWRLCPRREAQKWGKPSCWHSNMPPSMHYHLFVRGYSRTFP